MSKKYFIYLVKSLYPIIVVYGVIALLVTAIFPYLANIEPSDGVVYTTKANLLTLLALGAILPFILHSRYFSKNSSDIYLSLPLNRKQAFITENVFGLIIIVGVVLNAYLLGIGLTALASLSHVLRESYSSMFMGLPITLIAAITTYLMSVFAVSISNSGLEAGSMAFMIHGVFLLIYINLALASPVFSISDYSNPWISFCYGPGILAKMLYTYQEYDYLIGHYVYRYFDYWMDFLFLAINLVAWCLLAILAYYQFKRMKSEHLGTSSMEPFGAMNVMTVMYALIFSLIGQFFMIVRYMWNYSMVWIVFLILILVGFTMFWVSVFVLRRKIQFRKADVLRFVIVVVAGLIEGVLLNALLYTQYNGVV